MKSKVIDVKYRKDSKTFPEWLKYEVTLLHENGETEKIPAYGKDLQDALSRVVHDQKVKKILPKIEKIPSWVWALFWFGSLSYATYIITTTPTIGEWVGLVYLGVFTTLATITLTISNYFTLKNKDK